MVRTLDATGLTLLGTHVVDGSVFLTPFDAERILLGTWCESYGVPFAGSSAIGSLYRRN